MSVRDVCIGLFVAALAAACQPPPPVGASCTRTSECASGLSCRFGRCRAQCTVNADCPAGSACLLGADGSGVCGLDTDLGCQSGIGRTCATDLVCVADRCVRPCERASDCPADGQCLPLGDGTRFCFDGRASPDAGLPDVGSGDAWTPPPVDAGLDAAILRTGGLDLCVGPHSACVIAADRRVYCWGSDAYGQLGLASDCVAGGESLPAPRSPVVGLSDVDDLTCGDDFVCAHVASGGIRCWGRNDRAQLGRATPNACDGTPGPVVALRATALGPGGGLPSSVEMHASGAHTCVLDVTHGTFECWGANDRVFDGTTAATTSAMAVDVTAFLHANGLMPEAGLSTFALAPQGACIATSMGDVYCWGANEYGQLGARMPTLTVPHVTIPSRASFLSAGDSHFCAVDPLGIAYCWGDGRDGRLSKSSVEVTFDADCGPTMSDPCLASPTEVAPTSLRFSSLASAGATTCGAIDMRASTRGVLCWGDDTGLQAGVPGGAPQTFGDKATYTPVAGAAAVLDTVTAVAMGRATGCAIDTQGELVCWGDEDLDPATPPTADAVPIQVP